jgi:hypothetical protein
VVSFREASDRLRDELQEHKRLEELIKHARDDLVTALRARKLAAWGKRHNRRSEPSEYEAIPASVFLDELVSITEWGAVGPDPEHPTALFKYRGPTFREVRFYTADVINVWPRWKGGEAAARRTSARESELERWLAQQMRAAPNAPRSKPTMKEEANLAKLKFSERGFNRAWAKAVQRSGATCWSRPGRKS